MKVSEAIKQLKQVLSVEGDLELGVLYRGHYIPVIELPLKVTEPGDKVYDHWHKALFVGVEHEKQ